MQAQLLNDGNNLSDAMLYHSPTAAEKQNVSFTKLMVAVISCSNNEGAAYDDVH